MSAQDSAFLVSRPSSEEAPPASIEHLPPHATVSGKESVGGEASRVFPDGGYDHLQNIYQSHDFPNTSSLSTDVSKPTLFCEDQGHKSVQRVQHQGVLCWGEGCNQQAGAGPRSRDGEIDLFCSYHQSSDVIATRTTHCKFTGCLNIPEYGQRKGPLRFCQQHKRAGMHTNRNGQLLVATRDGSAFKHEDGTAAAGGARPTGNFAVRKEILDKVEGHNTTALYRKTCEVTGCHIQPSYGPSGTSRPRFCAGHKKEGMVGLKNRPCTFPGCSTRPHYGLFGCRAIYCAKHKEANMVHLLKEATTREKMDLTRNLGKATRVPPESRHLFSDKFPKAGKLRQKAPKNANTVQVGDNQLDCRKEGDGGSPLPLQKHVKKDAQRGRYYCRRKPASSVPSASSSAIPTSTPESSKKSAIPTKMAAALAQVLVPIETRGSRKIGNDSGASSSLPGKLLCLRSADTLDVSPSFEQDDFKYTRESVQMAPKASGSYRRLRVPSQKALEASGKQKNEGIQWLTKDMKIDEARRMKEFRAQRKAAAAVGLKTGQVIEAVTTGHMVGRDTDGSSVGDYHTARATNTMWRKLSPEEILEIAARKSIANVIGKTHPRGGGQVASEAGGTDNERRGDGAKEAIAGTSGMKNKGIARTDTPKSSPACPQGAKRRKESHGDQTTQMRQAITSADKKETREDSGWGSTGRYGGRVGSGEVERMNVCQSDGCSRSATFGVNGNVRYCKIHAIFGMRRISFPN